MLKIMTLFLLSFISINSALNYNGAIRLDHQCTEQDVHVNGSLVLTNSDLGSVRVNGAAEFKNSIIRNQTRINGLLSAQKCDFLGEITLAASLATLKECKAASIVIKTIGNTAKQILILDDGTEVDGDIFFESNAGSVILKGSSHVNGTVFGGEIQAH